MRFHNAVGRRGSFWGPMTALGSGTVSPTFFLTSPAIGTDGTPVVGELVSFDFGSLTNGDVPGIKQLIDTATGSTVQTITTGSFTLNAAGTFKLRVYATANPALFADSATITVATAVAVTMSPPTLSFPTGRVAGTNPPEVVVKSLDGTIDLTSDSLVIEWDRNASGGFTVSGSATIPLTLAMATAQEFTVTAFGSLAAGAIRFRAKFTRPDGSTSVYSAGYLADTLGAVAIPPATTTYDTVTRSQYPAYTNGNLTADFQNVQYQTLFSSTSRTDKRFVEVTYNTAGDPNGGKVYLGVSPSNSTITQFSLPSSYIGPPNDEWQYGIDAVAGTKIVVAIVWKVGATDGSITLYRNGVQFATYVNTQTDGRFFIAKNKPGMVSANFGQSAFTFIPPGFTLADRWN